MCRGRGGGGGRWRPKLHVLSQGVVHIVRSKQNQNETSFDLVFSGSFLGKVLAYLLFTLFIKYLVVVSNHLAVFDPPQRREKGVESTKRKAKTLILPLISVMI